DLVDRGWCGRGRQRWPARSHHRARDHPHGARVAMIRSDRATIHARPRGFTLIELMVALLVSSLLVGMILAIFSRMSLAYRGQQQIAGVLPIRAAARAEIDLDAKKAGFVMLQGFRTAITGWAVLQSPV